MGNQHQKTVKYRHDYKKPDFTISKVELDFLLDDQRTIVTSILHVIAQNPNAKDLVLHGEDLELISIEMNGKKPSFELDDATLRIKQVPQKATLHITVAINPEANTKLEGLYMSNGMFCSQNEPEGFRRITYFLDQPDVMSEYKVRIVGPKRFTYLLSNGNLISQKELPNGLHEAIWHDPFPKPSYLFALVAGDLDMIEDHFITKSKRTVTLRMFSEKGKVERCRYGLESLKRAMKWDEEVYGREYDLDIFMIVAVDAFNFGAMENKGLNIFNTSAVFASQDTETDDNFLRVEGVVAHEYFHNWTGDRITCRDWFQLTLKEGLTVFRDQEFSSDMNSRAVKRIDDVQKLRSMQFPEDAGPTAHAIQPDSYIEINNFYTPTVYQKGAEVIRMLHTIVGKERFRKGMDYYFDTYDGQAVTTEEFIHAHEVASKLDLRQFRRWYHQVGTPKIQADWKKDHTGYTLTLSQQSSSKDPLLIPCAVALFNKEGEILEEKLLHLVENENIFHFSRNDVHLISLNRNFTAPVQIAAPYTGQDYLFLAKHEKDPFSRWDAGQEIAKKLMLKAIQHSEETDKEFIRAFGSVLDEQFDHAFTSYALSLPSEGALMLEQPIIDIERTHLVREKYRKEIAHMHHKKMEQVYRELRNQKRSGVDPASIGARKLQNQLLSYLVKEEGIEKAFEQYMHSHNMTERYGALAIGCDSIDPRREEMLADFQKRYAGDLLTITKWFVAQASSIAPDTFERVIALRNHPLFDPNIPNHVRALIGAFSENTIHFHRKDGKGYLFLAECVEEIDKKNSAIAAKMALGFRKYAHLDSVRKAHMKKALEQLLNRNLSKDAFEIVSKTYDKKKPSL